MVTTYSARLRHAAPWFLAAGLAFYLIGVLGAEYLDERNNWPIHRAQVIDTNIKWTSGVADEYGLSILLKVYPKDKQIYKSSLYQTGPKGALEKRTQDFFAKGAWIEIRSKPGSERHIVLANEPTKWGPFIWAITISILIMSNGLTILRSDG